MLQLKEEREKVFAQFEDLVGVEAFDALRESNAEYSIEELEEKCYAIRGRTGAPANSLMSKKRQSWLSKRPAPHQSLMAVCSQNMGLFYAISIIK